MKREFNKDLLEALSHCLYGSGVKDDYGYTVPMIEKVGESYFYTGEAPIRDKIFLEKFQKQLDIYDIAAAKLSEISIDYVEMFYNAIERIIIENNRIKWSHDSNWKETLTTNNYYQKQLHILVNGAFNNKKVDVDLSSLFKKKYKDFPKHDFIEKLEIEVPLLENEKTTHSFLISDDINCFAIPVFSSKGMLIKKEDNKVDFQFQLLPIAKIKDVLNIWYKDIYKFDDIKRQQISAQFDKLRKDIMDIGECISNNYEEGLAEKLEKLGYDMMDMFGVDISKIK